MDSMPLNLKPEKQEKMTTNCTSSINHTLHGDNKKNRFANASVRQKLDSLMAKQPEPYTNQDLVSPLNNFSSKTMDSWRFN